MVVVARVCGEDVVSVVGGDNRVVAEVELETVELLVVVAQHGDGQGGSGTWLDSAAAFWRRRGEKE